VVSIDLRGPSTALRFAQDDEILGGSEGRQRGCLGDGLLGVHFFVGGDEFPAPGFGEVFEVWVLGAD
jgi:hypothetical protein